MFRYFIMYRDHYLNNKKKFTHLKNVFELKGGSATIIQNEQNSLLNEDGTWKEQNTLQDMYAYLYSIRREEIDELVSILPNNMYLLQSGQKNTKEEIAITIYLEMCYVAAGFRPAYLYEIHNYTDENGNFISASEMRKLKIYKLLNSINSDFVCTYNTEGVLFINYAFDKEILTNILVPYVNKHFNESIIGHLFPRQRENYFANQEKFISLISGTVWCKSSPGANLGILLLYVPCVFGANDNVLDDKADHNSIKSIDMSLSINNDEMYMYSYGCNNNDEETENVTTLLYSIINNPVKIDKLNQIIGVPGLVKSIAMRYNN